MIWGVATWKIMKNSWIFMIFHFPVRIFFGPENDEKQKPWKTRTEHDFFMIFVRALKTEQNETVCIKGFFFAKKHLFGTNGKSCSELKNHDFFMIFLGLLGWQEICWFGNGVCWFDNKICFFDNLICQSNRSYCQKNRSYCQSNRPHCQTSRSLVSCQPSTTKKNREKSCFFEWFFMMFHLGHPKIMKHHEKSGFFVIRGPLVQGRLYIW